jgi:hypothetical protein
VGIIGRTVFVHGFLSFLGRSGLGHPLEVALLSYSSLSFPWSGVIVMMSAPRD